MELKIQQVSKTYAGGIRALRGVSLSVAPGVFGLLGPNGAGKTTLITFHDCRAVRAEARRTPAGRYAVTLEVEARKSRADRTGAEADGRVDDWIEIGVFGSGGKELHLGQRHVTRGETVFEIEVSERPERAGIDPYGVLIDRDPSDNTLLVRLAGAE